MGSGEFVDFLRGIHDDLPKGYGIEVRRWNPEPHGDVYTLDEITEPDDLDVAQYGHAVVPKRLGSNSTDRAYLVWCDADGVLHDPATQVYPPPTAVVATGREQTRLDPTDGQTKTFRGFHIYWKSAEPMDVQHAVRLTMLATLAHGGDWKVVEPRRILRVPGSSNPKHGELRFAKVWSADYGRSYPTAELEERLVASVAARHFILGQRHTIALALGAVLARAGWEIDRSIRCFNFLMEMEPSDDPTSRLAAVTGTYDTLAQGKVVSSKALRDSMGKDDFLKLMTGLGMTARDGDLIVGEEVIGKAKHIERDLSTYVLDVGDYAGGDGKVLQWHPTGHWAAVEDGTVLSNVFSVMANMHVVNQGDVVEYVAKVSTASAVTRIISGTLLGSPLELPSLTHFPFANGTLDLETLELHPTTKDHRHRFVSPVSYDPTAECPDWMRFIEEVVPSEENRMHLQEWMGYSLMGGNPWEKMLWLYGPEGTGKSTYLRAVELLMGPAYYAITGNNLEPYTIAQLANRRVIGCSELSPRTLKTGVIKALVSGDGLEARHPYGRPFTLYNLAKIMWSSNDLPPLDQGEGMWRRIVPILFNVKPSRRDETLKSEKIPAQLSGILNWAIVGLRRMLDIYPSIGQWILPTSADKTIMQYRIASDAYARFVEEELDLDPGYKSTTIVIYQRYNIWAKERGMNPDQLGPRFHNELRRFGVLSDEKDLMLIGCKMKTMNYTSMVPSSMEVN